MCLNLYGGSQDHNHILAPKTNSGAPRENGDPERSSIQKAWEYDDDREEEDAATNENLEERDYKHLDISGADPPNEMKARLTSSIGKF